MKNIHSKIIVSVLIAVLLVGSNGCMTYSVVQKAKQGHVENNTWVNDKPNYNWYWWFPLTVPADIATSPIQLLGLGAFWGGVYIGAIDPEGM